ncbi:MAG: restriction endonuclease subunit S [Cycloclasticus sp.]
MSWGAAKLSEIAPAKSLKTPNIVNTEKVWQLNLDMVEAQTGVIKEKKEAPLSGAGSSTHWFDEHHVLYSKLRPYLNKVVLPDSLGLATTELVPMLPDPERLDRSYLAHYLRSKSFVDWISGQVAGAKMPRVSMKGFWDHEIPLPYPDDPEKSLKEQKRIAAILNKADGIRGKRQQAVQLADEFLRSVFLDMFGDPVTNPKGWDVKPLKKMALITTGNTPSRKVEAFYGTHMEWIKSDNINTPSYFLTPATEYLSEEGTEVGRVVGSGSTLITCIAGSFDCIGNAAYANREVAFNQQINALTPKESVSSWYLYALVLLSKRHIQSASTNSMKGMISKGKMEEICMICPPITEQEIFEFKFLKFLELRNRMSLFSKGGDEEFSVVSQKAFKGEL